jgi:NAD(P)-dependent dehydrogenase (short-subunit alcohol dehydrogenase family)
VSELRFDGRVVIVTGAGGTPSVGRAHARLFAERGAKVVVNDVGIGGDPHGSKPASAETIAAEINDAGGEAVADTHSVATEESAQRVVQTALDAWGRVDVLVNNAGVGVVADFGDYTSYDIQRLVDVHLMGGIWMSRAVWPHMIGAGYGRIVNTCSGGMYGMDGLTVYGAAKAGMYGLTRGLANEGALHGIRVNAISPGAYTNSVDPFYTIEDPDAKQAFIDAQPPELVSPAVVFLAHEANEVSGMLFDVSGGSVTATFLAASSGYQDRELTPEAVQGHVDQILDQSQLQVIGDPRAPRRINEMASLLVRKPYDPIKAPA